MRERPFPELPGVTHRMVPAGEVELHVAEAGEGEPVVLLHGWPQHWYMWRKVIPLLADRFRVHAVDLRGFGWSDAPASSYEKEELASDVIALLRALGAGPVRLAGHDWGGFVGFLATLRAPELVSGYAAFSILHPWSRTRLTPRTLARASYQLVMAAPGLGSLAQRRTGFLSAVLSHGGEEGIRSRAERESFVAPFREPARAEAASRVYRSFLLKERAALPAAYAGARLAVPARLTAGTEDPVITAALLTGFEAHGAELAAERIPGGHWLPEQHPAAVAERIAALPGPPAAAASAA